MNLKLYWINFWRLTQTSGRDYKKYSSLIGWNYKNWSKDYTCSFFMGNEQQCRNRHFKLMFQIKFQIEIIIKSTTVETMSRLEQWKRSSCNSKKYEDRFLHLSQAGSTFFFLPHFSCWLKIFSAQSRFPLSTAARIQDWTTPLH